MLPQRGGGVGARQRSVSPDLAPPHSSLRRGAPTPSTALDPHPTGPEKIMNTSLTHLAPAARLPEVPGTDRLRGRTQTELAEAMTWLAWYAPGVCTAVLDYMDTINGELI